MGFWRAAPARAWTTSFTDPIETEAGRHQPEKPIATLMSTFVLTKLKTRRRSRFACLISRRLSMFLFAPDLQCVCSQFTK